MPTTTGKRPARPTQRPTDAELVKLLRNVRTMWDQWCDQTRSKKTLKMFSEITNRAIAAADALEAAPAPRCCWRRGEFVFHTPSGMKGAVMDDSCRETVNVKFAANMGLTSTVPVEELQKLEKDSRIIAGRVVTPAAAPVPTFPREGTDEWESLIALVAQAIRDEGMRPSRVGAESTSYRQARAALRVAGVSE